MPRYYFHTVERTAVCDEEGTELPSKSIARGAALMFTAELVRELGKELYDTGLEVTVTDDAGRTLWTIAVEAKDTPAGVE